MANTESIKIQPRFEIGYNPGGKEPFPELVKRYLPHIDTVYFPWVDMPSGRSALGSERGYVDWGSQARLEQDLRALKAMGVRLNLLLNANCWGGLAASNELRGRLCSVIERLDEIGAAADIVTTCSPAVAAAIKADFPAVITRASVNMQIGTVAGMEYVADIFDEFNMQREFNRDFKRIRELKTWAGQNGKGLLLLANSGCLRHCSTQIFHGNLVAHEKDIRERDNMPGWGLSNCRRLLKNRGNWRMILSATWIRPEDIWHYTEYFPVVKLATRMHPNPGLIVNAYTRGYYFGALTDLTEPGFALELAPYILANHLFPHDWFERTTSCDGNCGDCGYCGRLFDSLLINTAQPDTFSF